MEPPGRIHQDANFDVLGLENEVVEELIGIVGKNDPDDRPIVVYLKTPNKSWQRFFLDVWIGFWEDWGCFTEYDEDEDDKRVDYGERFDIKGETLKSITCRHASITLALNNGDRVVLRLIDPEANDSESEIAHLPTEG